MKTITLGQDGPHIPVVGLGCMGMSEFYGPSDEAKSIEAIRHALDVGVTFLDTADAYGNGRNETLVARAIRDRRNDAVVATKFALVRGETGAFVGVSGKPDYVKRACAASLRKSREEQEPFREAIRVPVRTGGPPERGAVKPGVLEVNAGFPGDAELHFLRNLSDDSRLRARAFTSSRNFGSVSPVSSTESPRERLSSPNEMSSRSSASRVSRSRASRMSSRTVLVARSASTAGMRPAASARMRSRSATTAWRLSASRARTVSCSSAGNSPTRRPIARGTSGVWSEVMTRCPVSAALRQMSPPPGRAARPP